MKLNIGGHHYVIKEMEETIREDGKMLLGFHDVRECTITLDEGLKHSRKVETLLHEVIHVILTNTGCEHSERTIDSLSNGLLQLGVGDFVWKQAKSG
jgi:hypothetical protein